MPKLPEMPDSDLEEQPTEGAGLDPTTEQALISALAGSMAKNTELPQKESEPLVEEFRENKSQIDDLRIAMNSMMIMIDQLVKKGYIDPSLMAARQFPSFFERFKSRANDLKLHDVKMKYSPEAPVRPLNEELRFNIGKSWVFWIEFDEDPAGQLFEILVRFKRMHPEMKQPGSNESPTYAQPHDPNPSSSESDVPEPFREVVEQPE